MSRASRPETVEQHPRDILATILPDATPARLIDQIGDRMNQAVADIERAISDLEKLLDSATSNNYHTRLRALRTFAGETTCSNKPEDYIASAKINSALASALVDRAFENGQ